MTLITRLARAALITSLVGAASLCGAQGTPSPAKQALIQKALQLQQVGIEAVGSSLANQTASQVLQAAGQAVGRLPAENRQAVGSEIQADVRKFYDEIAPVLRASAVKHAPSVLGTALDEKFSEDELKQLIAWFESPVNKKFQQASGEMQSAFMQKLVAEARPVIEPKLQSLEQKVRAALGAPTAPAADASAPKPAARPPAKAASK